MKITVFISAVTLAFCSVHSDCVASEIEKPMNTNQEGKASFVVQPNTDQCRALIRDAIEQFNGLFLPSVRDRLLEELKRPIAFGGKSGHYPPSAADLETGWEVFVEGSSLRAAVEYTEGVIARGDARQIFVNISVIEGNAATAVFSVTVSRVGTPISKSDLENLRMNDEQLKAAGLK